MSTVPDKPKGERLKETITLLKRMQEVGIPASDPGYKEIQARLTTWVNTGEPDKFEQGFMRVDRLAQVDLPRRSDRAASINLKVVT
jgi:hypothetical protein